jgi:hypothetical protein
MSTVFIAKRLSRKLEIANEINVIIIFSEEYLQHHSLGYKYLFMLKVRGKDDLC